jgi:Cys-Gly metallodipeptidase DUG1
MFSRLVLVLICVCQYPHESQASKSDGWDTDPFTLTISPGGQLIGRGSTDDKGPILGWLNVLEAHQALQLSLPVNLRFCFEGMEESGSEGLDELIHSEVRKGKLGWFDGVDCVCIVSSTTRTTSLSAS